MSKAPELWYWNIKARGGIPVILAKYVGQELICHHKFNIPEMQKTVLPFGQYPYLEDNGVTLAQSGAIIRYLARKWKCDGGDNDQDFANANQLIDEYQDIMAHLGRGKGQKILEQVVKTDLPKHFGNLEKLLGSREYFSSQANVGDLAVFYCINIVGDVDPTFINNYPHLKAFYDRLSQHKGIKAWFDLKVPAYYHLGPDSESDDD